MAVRLGTVREITMTESLRMRSVVGEGEGVSEDKGMSEGEGER